MEKRWPSDASEVQVFIAYYIVCVPLAVLLLVSAYTKLARSQKLVAALGVPLGLFPFLAICEIAGAAGLVIGIWYAPLGVDAAAGVTLYLIGAVAALLRKSEFKGLPPQLSC